jgi:hypothetical protein
VLHAVRKELDKLFFQAGSKCDEPWGLGSGITKRQLQAAKSAAALRKLLRSVGVETKAQLLQLKDSAKAAKEQVLNEAAMEACEIAEEFFCQWEEDAATAAADAPAAAAANAPATAAAAVDVDGEAGAAA